MAMFEPNRRIRQFMDDDEIREIMDRNTNGVLSLIGPDGYPYGVPISYAYNDDKLFFHGAPVGHKIEAIKNCKRASFTIIDEDNVMPDKFSTSYKSVIAFGSIRLVDDVEEKHQALRELLNKYSSEFMDDGLKYIERTPEDKVTVMVMELKRITGKKAKELINAKK